MLLPETCDPNTAPSFDNGATVLATATNGHVITLACADTFETNDADVTCTCGHNWKQLRVYLFC